MAPKVHDGPVGSSSAIKMIRSVMIKGLEALACECALAGRAAGVDASRARFARRDLPRLRLEDARRLYDGAGDDARRAPRRGNARGALTVDELGLDGAMSRGAVAWQQRIGELALRAADGDPSDYRDLADRILSALDSHGETK